MVIRYAPDKSVLVVTKGHPFDHAAFFAMLDATLGSEDDGGGISWTHVEHPLAAEAIGAGLAESYDALLFYDMPGYDFRNPEPPLFVDPPEAFKQAFLDLTRRGKPMLFLHHAIASWPAWRHYGDLIGGHFNYERFPEGGVCDGYRQTSSISWKWSTITPLREVWATDSRSPTKSISPISMKSTNSPSCEADTPLQT